MNSRRMKSIVSQMIVKIAPKQVFWVQNKPQVASLMGPQTRKEEHSSLITPDQRPVLSDGPVSIPKGFMAVYVGPEQRRFLIPTKFLSLPDFKVVMDRAAEEFEYEQEGGLRIPCGEQDFEKLIASCFAACKMKNHTPKTYHR